MARLLAAAILICASVLGFAPGAGAGWEGEHRGRGHYRGRSHHYRGRGHYYRPRPPESVVPGILGGILGGWLSQQLKPAEPPRRYEDEEDDARRDRR
jgi:hypothetical protein